MAVQENQVVRLKKIFLSDLDAWSKVIEEETSSWIKSVMSFINLNNDIIFGKDPGSAVNYLIQNKVFIDQDLRSRSVRISKDGQTIGEWKSISVKTKVDDDGSPFAEISVDVWSVKDNPQQSDSKTKGSSK